MISSARLHTDNKTFIAGICFPPAIDHWRVLQGLEYRRITYIGMAKICCNVWFVVCLFAIEAW